MKKTIALALVMCVLLSVTLSKSYFVTETKISLPLPCQKGNCQSISFVGEEDIDEEEIYHFPEEEYKVPLIHLSFYYPLTFKEMDLLQQLAMEEARGEDAKGQALVMRVVINRAIKWNKSIEEIIYATGQFSTYGIGSYVPNEANNEAIGMIVDGWDESEGALYFCADGYNGKEPLFKYGGHYFSK